MKKRPDELDWAACLGKIAYGVEIRLNYYLRYEMTVIKETVAIARSLNIPKNQIEQWADVRQKRNIERINAMDCLIKKLEQTPIAQMVLGMTKLHEYAPPTSTALN